MLPDCIVKYSYLYKAIKSNFFDTALKRTQAMQDYLYSYINYHI
jgi:hypothetical protein